MIVTLDEGVEKLRLRSYAVQYMAMTNSAAKKEIKKGFFHINGLVALSDSFVVSGDEVVRQSQNSAIVNLPSLDIPILYEDDHLAIVSKPAGLLSSGNRRLTLANYLDSILTSSKESDKMPIPLLVHRLDRATSGLMLAAKTVSARIALGEMMAANEISKLYDLIVEGHVSREVLEVTSTIDGLRAITVIIRVQYLHTKDPTSYLQVQLVTGRTHQIRKHMLDIGHPLIGDPLYNSEGLTFGRGLMLACRQLGFTHPVTKEMVAVTQEAPKKFRKYLPNDIII